MARRGRGRGRGRGRRSTRDSESEDLQESSEVDGAESEDVSESQENDEEDSNSSDAPPQASDDMFREASPSSPSPVVETEPEDMFRTENPSPGEQEDPNSDNGQDRQTGGSIDMFSEQPLQPEYEAKSPDDTPPRESAEDSSDMFRDATPPRVEEDADEQDTPPRQDYNDDMFRAATPPRLDEEEPATDMFAEGDQQEMKEEEEETAESTEVTEAMDEDTEMQIQQQMYDQQEQERQRQQQVYEEQQRQEQLEAERAKEEMKRLEEEEFEREKQANLQEEKETLSSYKEIQYEWPTFKGEPKKKEPEEVKESPYRRDKRLREEKERLKAEQEKLAKEKALASRKGKKKKRRRKRTKAVIKLNTEYRDGDNSDDDSDVEIEYVQEKIELPKSDPNYALFNKIFETFQIEEKVEPKVEPKKEPEVKKVEEEEKDPLRLEEIEEKEDGVEKLSKKKLRAMNRMKIADLKQCVHRPDVVEMHDVNSKDPKLLVYLKAYKNTVPVPRHWCFKRKYLQGKRGFVKPPFELPEFIKNTGIMEMRAAMQEKEDAKTLKSKQRGKIRPKLGKIDIDYQKLHDAFFKYQTKPRMTIHGDLYYEGKEFEIKLKEKKPGDLSDELRTALGMPIEEGKELIPPPWLIAMQRYGPPPSYPNLKIAGLNAPIPEEASFGYHAGGWGKPPVDEQGKPLYGDVFGTKTFVEKKDDDDDDGVDKTLWGELESESSSEEESEDEEEDEDEAADQTGLVTPGDAGLVTPSGLSSVGAGMATPDEIELRKRKEIEDAMDTGGDTPALYTVLQEKQRNIGGSMMGSSHAYDLTKKTSSGEAVELTLDPSELEMGLEMDPNAMAAKYEQKMTERDRDKDSEDYSDMVAEHSSKNKKRKKPADKKDQDKNAKKYKEFKF